MHIRARALLSVGAVVLGCNALLDNEARTLDFGAGGLSASRGGAGPSGGKVSGSDAGEAGSGGAFTGGTNGHVEAGAFSSGGGGGGYGGDAGSANAGQATAGAAGAGGPACACTPMLTEQKPVACGLCGTAMVTRACNADCQWGEYGAPGTCTMPANACMPGTMGTDVGHCANGGWRDRVRTCNTNCTWGAWVDTSACQYGSNPCTGCACVSWCEDPKTGGTTCKWIGCSEAEARSECQADIKSTCTSTTQPFTFTDWRPN